MDQRKFDNEVVFGAVYQWVKHEVVGPGGPHSEPYSPVVASLTCLVMDILEAERVRSDPREFEVAVSHLRERVRKLRPE